MKLFLDTADVKDIEDRLSTGLISGVTTNPTLIKKSGRNPWHVYRDIIELGVTDLSIEVHGSTFKQFTENFEDQKGQIGWRGLSYRGIDLKKVRPFTEYGYNNEDEVPYIWTEMSDKCPNLKKELNFAFPNSKNSPAVRGSV